MAYLILDLIIHTTSYLHSCNLSVLYFYISVMKNQLLFQSNYQQSLDEKCYDPHELTFWWQLNLENYITLEFCFIFQKSCWHGEMKIFQFILLLVMQWELSSIRWAETNKGKCSYFSERKYQLSVDLAQPVVKEWSKKNISSHSFCHFCSSDDKVNNFSVKYWALAVVGWRNRDRNVIKEVINFTGIVYRNDCCIDGRVL